MIITSCKNLNLLKIQEKENVLYHENDTLILKSPIISGINESENYENYLTLSFDDNNRYNILFKDILTKINKIYTFIDDRIKDTVRIYLDDNSEFFDNKTNSITKNNFNKTCKIICTFYIKNNKLILHQCLKL